MGGTRCGNWPIAVQVKPSVYAPSPQGAKDKLTSAHRNVHHVDLLDQQNVGPDSLGLLGGTSGEPDKKDTAVRGRALEACFDLADDVVWNEGAELG
jgi:hypothetical protein